MLNYKLIRINSMILMLLIKKSIKKKRNQINGKKKNSIKNYKKLNKKKTISKYKYKR